jgi:molecular chaperone DnaK (HSP70)
MNQIAVDFGSTNTVVAIWNNSLSVAESLHLPQLSKPQLGGAPPLIPSTLYVCDGSNSVVLAGQSAHEFYQRNREDNRYFSSFKRGIAAFAKPLPRSIDGADWTDSRAGAAFLMTVFSTLLDKIKSDVDELVLTVPVESFEQYLKWLRDDATEFDTRIKQLRIIDESTAAALGYNVRTPGDIILIFDFGGGTLDVSIVRMPFASERQGVVLRGHPSDKLRRDTQGAAEARVIAKAGRVLGGDDIDHWLLDELLSRTNLRRSDINASYMPVRAAVESAKLALSEQDSTDISVDIPEVSRVVRTSFTRIEFEEIIERRGLFDAIQKTLDRALRSARAKGVFPEDISAVLLVGGTSMIPSIRRMIRTTFGSDRVHEYKPFEAVAHGALGLVVGMGIDDYLYHSYGIRHLSPITGRHEWEEIISAGSRYPLPESVKLVLTASRDGQDALELVVGEVEDSASGLTEVMFGERAILMVEGGLELRRIVPLNDQEGARTVATLNPPGKAGEDRVEVYFTVDQNRTLRVTVIDLLSRSELLKDIPVVEIR